MASKCSQAELSPVLQSVEHALDDVAGFGEIGVILELHFAVLARWDAGGCLGVAQPVAQVICVVTSACNDGGSPGNIWLKALIRMGNIGSMPAVRCSFEFNPPFVLPISRPWPLFF
nr:hypothetical protein [Aliiroseovarius crassostreae]